MTSATNETDAEVVRRNYGHNLIPADFARALEAERNAFRDALEHLAAQADDTRCKPDGYAMAEYARAALARSTDRR